RFELRDVPLPAEENVFTAVAGVGSGDPSPPSAEMIVLVGAAVEPEVADLAVDAAELVVLPVVPVHGTTATLSATVRNVGTGAATASEVDLLLLAPDGASVTVAEGLPLAALGPGAAATVGADFVFAGGAGTYTLIAVADPRVQVAEATKDNNRAQQDFQVLVAAGPALFLTTDRASYLNQQQVAVTVEVLNGGTTFTGTVEAAIEDAAGYLVADLPPVAVTDLGYGERATQELTWSTGDVFAGDYQVRGLLLDAGG
ncbi:MAG: hypothetical protein GY836_02850, partial [Herbaspirillum sp.]|uniref:CARDB domain-containing protein n=1 Tax=Herbaspirillum sp. TaxID=1890675 RepID=UPI002582606C